MVRKPTVVGPRLEALLDERDHLRIKISLAEMPGADPTLLLALRKQLADLDRQILKRWETPDA